MGAVGGGNNLTLTGNGIFGPGNTLTISNTSPSTITITGSLGDTGSPGGTLTKTNTGTLVLSGSNTYAGPTNINGGTLQLAAASIPANSAVTVAAGATFDVNGTTSSIGSLAGAGTVNLSAGLIAGTLGIGGNNTSTTFSGVIGGSNGQLVKQGTGTLTLSGANTYTGATTINAGTLLVNGTVASASTTVNNGGTLGGSGTLSGGIGILVNNGGTVSPGGPGTGVLKGVFASFAAGSIFRVKLNSTTVGSGYDQLNITPSPVFLGGNPTLNVSLGFTPNIGDTFTIIQDTGGVNGTFNGLPNNSFFLVNGQQFRINYTANSAVLTRALLPTSTTVVSSVNPSMFGQPVTFTATVTPLSGGGTPTGTVTFTNGGTVLGSMPLNANGQAAITSSTLPLGNNTIIASYGGDSTFAPSDNSASALTQVVNKANTTTVLQSSANPSVFGQAVTFRATVAPVVGTGVPTGTVTFTVDGSPQTPVTLLDGLATFGTATLGAGNHTVTAAYSGDANFNTSTSGPLTQTVNKANTTTVLQSSVNPSVFGQTVTFTATVSVIAPGAGTPSGTVTFTVDGTAQPPVTLGSNGQATFAISTLTVGQHSISATYGGDTNFNGSTSPALTQTVTAAAVSTTTTVTSTLNPSFVRFPFTITALVAPTSGSGIPTGSVIFSIDGTPQAPKSLVNGRADLFMAFDLGSHSIVAVYSGDSNFSSSTSAPLIQTIIKGSTTTSLSSSNNPSVFGQATTFSAQVQQITPPTEVATGTVTFRDGPAVLGDVPVSGSGITVTFTTSTLSAGPHLITATYNGNAFFDPSTSPTLTQTVKASTSTILLTTTSPSSLGQAVTFIGRVTVNPSGAGSPTGTVTFRDGSTVLGTGNLDSRGIASFATTGLLVGQHAITATYEGNSNFASSTSSPFVQLVTPTDTQIILTANPNPTRTVQTVVVTARVAPVLQTVPTGIVPTGTVMFSQDGTVLGTARVDSTGTAPIALSFLTGGSHTVTARYSGDGNFNASTGSFVESIACNPSETFLGALYQTLLKRSPDLPGFVFWLAQLNAGLSRNDVSSGFETSPEYRGLVVDNFYQRLLSRAPDAAGRQFFVNLLLTGHSTTEVATLLASSPEYFANHGQGTNAGFISALYQDILLRPATAAEIAAWLPVLQQGGVSSRAGAAFQLLRMPEGVGLAVDDNYREILGRQESALERQAWIDAVFRNAVSPIDLTAVFAGSSEFFIKAAQKCG
jgi:autotransporter-associated beta strand protein